MAAMIVNFVIVLLLVGGITYGLILSRKVRSLVAILQELEPAVRAFSVAVDKSEAAVSQLHTDLDAKVDDAAQADVASFAFSSRREPVSRVSGVRLVRDKQELVRQFFETTRSEGRA